MLRKEQLTSLAAKFQAKADKAFQNYQATGIQRYDREYRNNEDLADALNAAANAADDHQALGNLRAEVIWYAAALDGAVYKDASWEELAATIKGFLGMAEILCNYKRREEIVRNGE